VGEVAILLLFNINNNAVVLIGKMCKLKDLTGQRFGRYVVLSRSGVGPKGMATWLCKCDCGTEKIMIGNTLRMGKVISCGCYFKEVAYQNGKSTKKHGQTRTPTYKSWQSMLERCYNKNVKYYNNYGGRGIEVCERWKTSYENFYEDMGLRPGKEYSLDRIDVNKNYSPENCRWATNKEQSRNKRNTVYVEYEGQKMPIIEASEKSGIPYRILLGRLNKLEWAEKDIFALYTPRKKKNAIQIT
jgi:hypothetical protein